MDKVPFDEVKHIFHKNWVDSAEHLFCEIAWNCLEQAGYTQYSNEKTHAQIYVYAYIVQMLCDEFSHMAYDEPCAYEYEIFDEELLTDAAIGWLYRDHLSTKRVDNIDEHFSSNAHEVLVNFMFEMRYTVADVIFDQFGEYLVGTLLYFAVLGKPLEDDDDDLPMNFQTKDELLAYCKEVELSLEDVLTYNNAIRTWHWLESHSCMIDD